eukprot:6919903-Ditylum_brightwellii.AAC.1
MAPIVKLSMDSWSEGDASGVSQAGLKDGEKPNAPWDCRHNAAEGTNQAVPFATGRPLVVCGKIIKQGPQFAVSRCRQCDDVANGIDNPPEDPFAGGPVGIAAFEFFDRVGFLPVIIEIIVGSEDVVDAAE